MSDIRPMLDTIEVIADLNSRCDLLQARLTIAEHERDEALDAVRVLNELSHNHRIMWGLEEERDKARAVAHNLARRAQEYPECTDLRKELLLAQQENPWLMEEPIS